MITNLILLIIYTIIVSVILYFIQIPFRKIKNKFILLFFFLLKVVLTLYLGLMLIAFAYKIVWNHEYPFAALYLALIPDIFKDIICFVLSCIRKNKTDNKLKIIISAVLTVLFILYNYINMQTITAKYHDIYSPKLKHEYKMVLFSDLHYGSSQSSKTVYNALDQIKSLNPDYLLLAGDITDENTTKEEMINLYQKIGSLDIPTYFIYGNHDRQERAIEKIGFRSYSEEDLEKAITSNGIKILYEDYEEINDDLIIFGREDPSHPDKRKAVKDLPKPPSNRYVFVIDHTPYQNEEIKELKADLQFSGHTHAAQFFPIKTIYKLLGYNVYGDYYIGDTHLYVSPGIAGWGLPLRSEAHCNYEVINLIPE